MSAKDTKFQHTFSFKLREKLWTPEKAVIMGILNLTDDSFYSGSRIANEKQLLLRAEKMLYEGADALDIGAYSTRPGATDIPIEEECKRIYDATKLLHNTFKKCTLSVDSFRPEVAKIALNEGVQIVNDISGGSPEMWKLCAEFGAPYILMHMRGTPQTMMKECHYSNLFMDVFSYFTSKIEEIQNYGVHDIIVDLGFGFAKTVEQNFVLLKHLEDFHALKRPLLVGVSRKSMIYKTLNSSAGEALNGTTALHTVALLKGAQFLRVHDVKEALEVRTLLNTLNA